jgi:hypothetical protein
MRFLRGVPPRAVPTEASLRILPKDRDSVEIDGSSHFFHGALLEKLELD